MEPAKIGETPFWADKNWMLAVATVLLLVLSKKFGIELDPTLVVAIILPVVAQIASSKYKQATVLKGQIEAGHFDPPVPPVVSTTSSTAGK